MTYDPERARQMIEEIESSRRDFERETESRRKLLAIIHERMEGPPPLPDDLEAISEADFIIHLNACIERQRQIIRDQRQELGSLARRLIAAMEPEPEPDDDPLIRQIDEAWIRLSEDFHRYRRQGSRPLRKPYWWLDERKGGGNASEES